jgi:hypothetical protein
MFLQHLAFAAYCRRQNISVATTMLPPPQLSPRSIDRAEKESQKSREAWVKSIRVAWSSDGTNFQTTQQIQTGLSGYDDIKKVGLNNSCKDVKCVRIYATSWDGPLSCMRFCLHQWRAADAGAGGNGKSNLINPEKLIAGLGLMRVTADTLSQAAEFLNRMVEVEQTRKQDEVRKV